MTHKKKKMIRPGGTYAYGIWNTDYAHDIKSQLNLKSFAGPDIKRNIR